MAVSLAELAMHASQEAVDMARTVLEQDLADQAWASQVGSAMTQRDTARLLGRSEQSVSKDPRLLRLRQRDGRPVYPILQFEGRRQREDVADVVRTLAGAVQPLTIASWLTSRNRSLGKDRPIDLLRAGFVEDVLMVARRFAARASV